MIILIKDIPRNTETSKLTYSILYLMVFFLVLFLFVFFIDLMIFRGCFVGFFFYTVAYCTRKDAISKCINLHFNRHTIMFVKAVNFMKA